MGVKLPPRRPFWLDLLTILGADGVLVLIIALFLRNMNQVSNLFFFSGIVFFIIAVVPAISEVSSNTRLAKRALTKGEKLSALLKENEPRYREGGRTTYLFGIAGVVTFILSILFA